VVVWSGVGDALVWPVGVVKLLIVAGCVEQVSLVSDEGAVEQGRELAVPVADQDPRSAADVVQIHDEVAAA
jgi:hypothetical protein